jgi:hypothetical protein
MSATMSIWGEPLVATPRVPKASWDGLKTDEELIERELRTFLEDEITTWKPDLIVVYERKGTAILRAMIECGVSPLQWPWEKVVSSSSLDQLSDDALRNRRILIFDDMIKTGNHIRRVTDILKARKLCDDRMSNVRLAAFAAHEEFSSRSVAGRWLDAWFYRDLTSMAYAGIRERIIRLLQKSGSLMLDTEHIEVRLQLRDGFNRLSEALRRRADPVEFRSAGDRTNITVYYGDDPAHKLPEKRFPKNTGFTDIVKKCRIVERDNPDEFAIIPICLPAIPIDSEEWIPQDADTKMLRDGIKHQKDTYARFYSVALIASLYPLEWILKDLYASNLEGLLITLPSLSDDPISRSSYTLDHLKVMYPGLDTDALVRQIKEVEGKAKTEGKELRPRKHKNRPVLSFSNECLYANAMDLLQVIRHSLDVRYADTLQGNIEEATEHVTQGLRANEIFALGKRFGWEPARISTLFDILIDDAKLVTRVERTRDEHGQERWTRTFRPDGEVISDLVRRYTAQWGLPHGF